MRALVLINILVLAGVAIGQVPPGFEVVKVTEADALRDRPDINSASTVVWAVRTSENTVIAREFNNGIVRTIIDDAVVNGVPAINDKGDVVVITGTRFSGPFDVAVHGADGSKIVFDVTDAVSFVDINDSGQVVWVDDFSGNSTHTDMYVFDGMSSRRVTFNGLQNSEPRMNTNGEVVFKTRDIFGTLRVVQLFDGSVVSLLSDQSVVAFSVDLNDVGDIVWTEEGEDLNRIILQAKNETVVVSEGVGLGRCTVNNLRDIAHGQINPATSLSDTVLIEHDGSTYTLPGFGLNCEGVRINDRAEVVWKGTDGGLGGILLLRRIAPNGDFNHDCRINAYDLAILENCYTGDGNGPAGGLLADCTRADFDGDGDVDQADVDEFMAVVTGVEGMVDGCER